MKAMKPISTRPVVHGLWVVTLALIAVLWVPINVQAGSGSSASGSGKNSPTTVFLMGGVGGDNSQKQVYRAMDRVSITASKWAFGTSVGRVFVTAGGRTVEASIARWNERSVVFYAPYFPTIGVDVTETARSVLDQIKPAIPDGTKKNIVDKLVATKLMPIPVIATCHIQRKFLLSDDAKEAQQELEGYGCEFKLIPEDPVERFITTAIGLKEQGMEDDKILRWLRTDALSSSHKYPEWDAVVGYAPLSVENSARLTTGKLSHDFVAKARGDDASMINSLSIAGVWLTSNKGLVFAPMVRVSLTRKSDYKPLRTNMKPFGVGRAVGWDRYNLNFGYTINKSSDDAATKEKNYVLAGLEIDLDQSVSLLFGGAFVVNGKSDTQLYFGLSVNKEALKLFGYGG